MPLPLLFLSVCLPLLMTAAAIVTIHRMREHDRNVEAASKWRDDSLDDWRHERELQLAAEREEREATRKDELVTGRAEESEEPVQQQRLGG
jgi:hypothetical protein